MKKRLLSALLALVMVLALLPVSVFADPSPTGVVATEAKPEVLQADTSEENEEINDVQDGENQDDGGNEKDNLPPQNIPKTPVVQSMNTATGAHDGKTAKYFKTTAEAVVNRDGVTTKEAVTEAPAWYVEVTETVNKVNVTSYYKITEGFIVGTKYYNSTLPKDNPNSVTVFGNSGTITTNSSTLTIDVYGSGSAVSVNYTGTNAFTLNVTDSKYFEEFRDRGAGTKNTVTLTSINAANKSTTLKLTNVSTGAINLSGEATHTVELDNADADAITLSGVGTNKSYAQTVKVNQNGGAQNRIRGSEVGAISVTGNSSKVYLTDCKQQGSDGVTMSGTGTQLDVDGYSDVGNVEITDTLAAAATTAYSTINVKGGTVGNVSLGVSGKCAGAVKINVTGGEVGDIDLTRTAPASSPVPTITVSGGATTGAIKMKGGTLSVSGAYAKVGNLDLSGSAKFTLGGNANNSNNTTSTTATSGHHTVGEIKVTSDVTLTIPADPTNTLDIGDSGDGLNAYKQNNILGGTWKKPVPADALSTTLVYQLKQGSPATYTYYNENQLAEALVSESLGTNSPRLTAVGVGDSPSYSYTLKFMNGKTEWGEMIIAGPMTIKLPTSVNNVTVTRWADKNRSWNAGVNYPVPTDVADGGTWELNASGGVTNGDITRLKSVSVQWTTQNNITDEMGVVKASLNNTVITLTGAVPTGTSEMTLVVTTDAVEVEEKGGKEVEVPVTIKVPVTYYGGNSKTLMFSNVADKDLGHGAVLLTDTGTTVLRLSNGTTYTLNGSGLKERANNIEVLDGQTADDDTFENNFIEVTVSASNYRTGAAKAELVDLINGSGAKFDWSTSPAVKEAVNAALSTITTQQVETWIKQAQEKAWKAKHGNTGYTTAKGADTGYDKACLVVYLQVNVSDYKPNGSLTATLVPSWRVEIRQTTQTAPYDTSFLSVNDANLPGDAYIAKAGASLGALNSYLGTDGNYGTGVKVSFSSSLFSGKTPMYLHQDNTYVYSTDDTSDKRSYMIRHAGSNGLGSVVINETTPLVEIVKKNGDHLLWYDTLQAAVNDVVDGQTINVDQYYKGSMNINVTGDARTFYIQAHGNNVVVANASGGLVTLNGTGGLYTVQLNRDNTAVAVDATTATIAVNSVANGSAVVSATTAKSGTTITVTCTPAAGYSTRSVTVSAHMTKTNTNSAVTATKVSDNVYSFKVPQGADTITVTPNFVLGTTPAAIPFTDVATNHWAYNSVKYVYDNGLMNGVNTAGTQFGGTQTLNRAMVVTILYRAAGSPYVGTSSSFSDVANNTWYSQAVAWANQNHIVEGYTNGTFQPTWNITRQELATILYRYNTTYKGRATTGSTTLANFPDQGNVSDWATAGMQWAVGNGIVNGITNGYSTTLSPSGSATRYEAATMLMRYGQGMGL